MHPWLAAVLGGKGTKIGGVGVGVACVVYRTSLYTVDNYVKSVLLV